METPLEWSPRSEPAAWIRFRCSVSGRRSPGGGQGRMPEAYVVPSPRIPPALAAMCSLVRRGRGVVVPVVLDRRQQGACFPCPVSGNLDEDAPSASPAVPSASSPRTRAGTRGHPGPTRRTPRAVGARTSPPSPSSTPRPRATSRTTSDPRRRDHDLRRGRGGRRVCSVAQHGSTRVDGGDETRDTRRSNGGDSPPRGRARAGDGTAERRFSAPRRDV